MHIPPTIEEAGRRDITLFHTPPGRLEGGIYPLFTHQGGWEEGFTPFNTSLREAGREVSPLLTPLREAEREGFTPFNTPQGS